MTKGASKTTTTTKKTAPVLDLRNIRPQGTGFRIEVMVKGQKKSGSANTIEEAILLRNALRNNLKTPEDQTTTAAAAPARVGWTLEEAIEKTFKLHWVGTADESKQRIRCGHLKTFFGPTCLLTDITPDHILEFRDWAEAALKNSPNTINKKVMALSRVMRTARDLGKLKETPKMHMARIKNGRIRVFSLKEEAQIGEGFKNLASADHYEAFVTLIDTGFRLGELWSITAASVNVFNNFVSLQADDTKNDEARSVPMTTRVREILTRRAKWYPEGPLWPGGKNNWFQHQWNKVRTSLGKDKDPEWVAHALRHTYITRMVIATGDVFLVQRLAGHKTLLMTQRYTHHAPQHMAAAAKKLEDYTDGHRDGMHPEAKKRRVISA